MAKYRASGLPPSQAAPAPLRRGAQQQDPPRSNQEPLQSYQSSMMPPPPAAAGYDRSSLQKEVDEEILLEKERTINELREVREGARTGYRRTNRRAAKRH